MLLLYKNQIRWRRIQNRAKHLKWRFLQKQLTALDVWQGFEYVFVKIEAEENWQDLYKINSYYFTILTVEKKHNYIKRCE